ncbi:hypothetical protein LOTGIDRAFT_209898, partial [Lottia gigantea]
MVYHLLSAMALTRSVVRRSLINTVVRGYSEQVGKNVPSTKHLNASLAAAEPFLSGTSSIYVEEMYSQWQKDPTSVHK